MLKPKLYDGLSYYWDKEGVAIFSIPNSDVGAKVIAVKISEQTTPLIVLLRRFIDEATKPKWYPPSSAELKKLLQKEDVKVPSAASGRVTRVKESPSYDPDNNVHGGRVVRVMPKQLKKIKEAQERDE